MIEAALGAGAGRVFRPSGAAARLGIPRSTLKSKIIFFPEPLASYRFCSLRKKNAVVQNFAKWRSFAILKIAKKS
jgi:hypothetical protein